MTPSLADLHTEMLNASARMPYSAMRRLWSMGADRRFTARLRGAGDLGVTAVDVEGSTWAPGTRERRLLVGVRCNGDLIDMVALSSTRRDEWALRTGLGWALGMDQIERAHAALASDHRHVKLRLHATPFDWMAAAGDGVCVLDWCAASLAELRMLGGRATLEVAPGAREGLENLLVYGGLPRVSERADGMGIAA